MIFIESLLEFYYQANSQQQKQENRTNKILKSFFWTRSSLSVFS